VAAAWGFATDDRAGDLTSCNKWCQHAISVSRFVGDDGTFEKTVYPFEEG